MIITSNSPHLFVLVHFWYVLSPQTLFKLLLSIPLFIIIVRDEKNSTIKWLAWLDCYTLAICLRSGGPALGYAIITWEIKIRHLSDDDLLFQINPCFVLFASPTHFSLISLYSFSSTLRFTLEDPFFLHSNKRMSHPFFYSLPSFLPVCD